MTEKLLILITLSLISASAQAQAQDPLLLLLGAHHEAPTADALHQAAADPVEALEAIADDEAAPMALRRRAVLSLGRLNDPRVDPLLVERLQSSPRAPLRQAAASALAGRLAGDAPELLVHHLSTFLVSDDPGDRELAVWLLSRLTTPRARRLLERHRVVERNRAVVDALRRVLSPSAQQ